MGSRFFAGKNAYKRSAEASLPRAVIERFARPSRWIWHRQARVAWLLVLIFRDGIPFVVDWVAILVSLGATIDIEDRAAAGLYPFQTDWAPRFGLAYSPQGRSGLARWLFGGPDRSSIRFKFRIFYDAFGEGLERDFVNNVGFSTEIQSQPGQLIATVPRFTGLNSPPISAFPAAPAGGFPQQAPPVDLQSKTIDDQLKAPYTMNWNLSYGRQFDGGFYLQIAGVHREAIHSLIGEDFAQMTNLKDPASGMTYYQAVAAMVPYVFAGTPPNQVPNIPFWHDMWPGAAGNGLTATQGVYTQYLASGGDWTTALLNVDVNCNPSCSSRRSGRFCFDGHDHAHAYQMATSWHTRHPNFSY